MRDATAEKPTNVVECNEEYDFLKIQYQVLAARQLNHNSLVWNTPSLLFVAEALLWNIVLDDKICKWICCMTAAASVIIAFVSLQAFLRNRLMDVVDATQLYSIERRFAAMKKPSITVYHSLENRTELAETGTETIPNFWVSLPAYKNHLLSHIPTFNLWTKVFWMNLAINVVLFVYTLYSAVQ